MLKYFTKLITFKYKLSENSCFEWSGEKLSLKLNEISKYLNNTTLFVSLEPCMMCAAAISKVHISKVYFGAYDEKKGGLDNLSITFKQNNFFLPEIYGGIHEKESLMLLKKFFKNNRK